jgi:ankyrin repeat protein
LEQPTTVVRHDTLRAMMEDDAFDINTTRCGPRRMYALHFALGAGDEPIDEEAVKLVLDAPGLNVHVTDPEGGTMLYIQCSLGRSQNVELRLADGRIDPNQCSTDKGESPLHIAANLGRDLCIKLLLADPRVDPNLSNFNGYTPLNIASNQGRDLCVKLLLADPRVDPNLACLQGYTPLNIAANTGRDGCVELLLADGRVDVHLAADGMTPLVSACMQLAATFDQVGAPEPPTRCLVLLLKSRRISNYYMKESIAFLRGAMPTRRQIATAEASGKPLTSHLKMARLLLPVLLPTCKDTPR